MGVGSIGQHPAKRERGPINRERPYLSPLSAHRHGSCVCGRSIGRAEACGPIAANTFRRRSSPHLFCCAVGASVETELQVLVANTADNAHDWPRAWREDRSRGTRNRRHSFLASSCWHHRSSRCGHPSKLTWDGFPNSSWDVMIPMQISLPSIGAMLAGVALLVASTIRLRSQKN